MKKGRGPTKAVLRMALRIAKGTALALGVAAMLCLTLAVVTDAAGAKKKVPFLKGGVSNTVEAATAMTG